MLVVAASDVVNAAISEGGPRTIGAMAISFSRPDPSSPAAVSEAAFGTARKGFDQHEVRDFLRMVAAELSRLQERETFLERELRAAQVKGAGEAPAIDEETVTRMLGEEAARILHAARDASNQIKAKAEDGASRLVRESTDEANRQRQDAELEAARRRSDAAADAEAELSIAKQQGREMVEEARAYRERVLGELARRRELARQQIDQLLHGRDRLLQAFERARLVAVDVVEEISPLAEPEEYVDLSPTTGPVPLTVPLEVPAASLGDASAVDARAMPGEVPDAVVPAGDESDDAPTGEQAMYDREDEEPENPPPSIDPAADDPAVGGDLDDVQPDELDGSGEAGDVPDGPDATLLAFPTLTVGGDETDAGAGVAPQADPNDDVGAATGDEAAVPGESDEIDDDATATDVDDLFARLRADQPLADELDDADATSPSIPDTDTADTDTDTAVAADPEADPEAEAESAFDAREAELVPLIVASARKLKRALADEQNEVLDALRHGEPIRSLDELVSAEGDQADRYADTIAAELAAAAQAGAASMPGDVALEFGPTGTLAPIRASLTAELVVPLREKLTRAVEAGEGDNDAITKRIRSVYREWKTQRIDEQLDDLFRSAYARSAFEVVEPGTSVSWVVDPDGPSSPDCEDNSLAGDLVVGDAFPTGHVCPPAHPGCRCLLATVGQ